MYIIDEKAYAPATAADHGVIGALAALPRDRVENIDSSSEPDVVALRKLARRSRRSGRYRPYNGLAFFHHEGESDVFDAMTKTPSAVGAIKAGDPAGLPPYLRRRLCEVITRPESAPEKNGRPEPRRRRRRKSD